MRLRDMLSKKIRWYNCTSIVVIIMYIYMCVCIFRCVYTPAHYSETGKNYLKCTELLKTGKIMDNFFILQTFLH